MNDGSIAKRALSVSIVTILVIVLVAVIALAIILVSRMLYRRHLDRVVAGKERDTHSRTFDPISVAKVVFAAIAIIWMVASMIYISQLRTQLDIARLELENYIGSVERSIAELRTELKEEKALFAECEFEIQSIDPEKKTADVLFRVVPKKVDANATIQVSWGSYSTELKEEGGTYKGIMTAPLFETVSENPVLTIQNGSVKETEIMENAFYGSLADCIVDGPMGDLYQRKVTFSDNNETIDLSGHLCFWGKGLKHIPGLKGTKVDLVVRSGGTEMDRIPVPYDFAQMGEVEKEIGGVYGYIGDKIEFLIEVTTESGWTISSKVLYIEKDSKEVVDVADEYEVRDKDGTLLCSTGNPISWSETSEEHGGDA